MPRRKPSKQLGRRATLRSFLNLLPYLKDWEDWQVEVHRLEGDIVKLRNHGEEKLARTLEDSLPTLKSALKAERENHQFTVNKFIRELER